jgi:ubiquinone/menaquinone biosynthesis C-methylase UbiE
MTEYEIVDMAKKRFDQELHTPGYKKIHADEQHREQLLAVMEIEPQRHYLDLGTGNGYMAFELARRFSNIFVTGVDIAENSIAENQRISREEQLNYVMFQTYEGMELPFHEHAYHGVVSRYAFHHFPKPHLSACEIARVLQPDGYFVLADPVAYDEDTVGFIDRFQQLIPDGHVCFYKNAERERIFQEVEFYIEEQFFTSVTYPRKLHEGYTQLFEQTPQHILDCYALDVRDNEVWITVKVANTKFRKN